MQTIIYICEGGVDGTVVTALLSAIFKTTTTSWTRWYADEFMDCFRHYEEDGVTSPLIIFSPKTDLEGDEKIKFECLKEQVWYIARGFFPEMKTIWLLPNGTRSVEPEEFPLFGNEESVRLVPMEDPINKDDLLKAITELTGLVPNLE